jgi:hypothetical protein
MCRAVKTSMRYVVPGRMASLRRTVTARAWPQMAAIMLHNGTMAQWHNGTMAQWSNGTMAQWVHCANKKQFLICPHDGNHTFKAPVCTVYSVHCTHSVLLSAHWACPMCFGQCSVFATNSRAMCNLYMSKALHSTALHCTAHVLPWPGSQGMD